MKHRPLRRLYALGIALALTLTLTPTARALTLEQARELLSKYYIDPISEEVLSQPTILDMLQALGDPYTVYFTPEEYQQFNSSMQDSTLIGIGISSTQVENGLRVEYVYADSPAEQGGLRSGDVITAVDGKTAGGVDLETAAGWLHGEEGSSISITYLRDGASRTISLIRRKIVIPATITRLEDGHIGFITCDTFGGETLGHFTDGITANDGAADHWILDLRGNGGGTLDAAIYSAGLFTGSGALAYLRDGAGTYGAYGTDEQPLTLDPVIVLTSPYTASSAELFSAAVRDRNAGICVGERTYGKGVAQSVLDNTQLPDYFPDGDAIKITAYRFFSPAGNTNDTVGIIPHLLVPEQSAEAVARLLCASGPKGGTANMLRLDFGWRWFIDLDAALLPENREAFALLLEAIPSNVRLLEGTGDADGWRDTTPQAVAQAHGVDCRFRGFSDTEQSPYGQQIDILAVYGIVQGDGSGAFRPEGSLTRAQLCALLYQALGCSSTVAKSRFSDVSLDAWYGQAVNALADLGFVSGVGGGTFRPDDPVTHEQFITIMGRIAKWLNMYLYEETLTAPADSLQAPELDGYASWAKGEAWLLALSQQGIQGESINLLWEDLDAIAPLDTTTREEAASLVYTVLSYVGILPA